MSPRSKRSGATSGPDSGADSGEGSGAKRAPAVDLDDLEPELQAVAGDLTAETRVFEADFDGKVPGGSRLGDVATHPLDTIGTRIVDEWGGPKTYWLRFKYSDGRIARWAKLRQKGPRAGRAQATPAAAPPPVVVQAPPQPQPQGDSLLRTLSAMRDLGLWSPPAPASAVGVVAPRSLSDQVKDLDQAVGSMEKAGLVVRKSDASTPVVVAAIEKLAPVVVESVGALVGGMMALAQSRVAAAQAMRQPQPATTTTATPPTTEPEQ